MADEVIEHYVDRAKFGSDTEFILAQIKQAETALVGINEALAKVRGATGIKGASEGAQQGAKANKILEESVKAVNKVLTDRIAAEAKLAAAQSTSAKALAATKIELQQQNKELKIQAELQLANTGSIEKARAAVKKLTDERNKLNLFTEEGRKRQAQLNEQIDKYNNFIKKNVDSLAKQKINIGNYSGAVVILKKSFDEVVAKIDQFNKEGNDNKEVLEQLTREYNLLNKLVNSQEAGFANATQEIKANQRALLDLEAAGLSNTESFRQLEKATGELQDQLGDLKARTKQLGSDTFVFDGLINAAEGLAGAYGAAQGVAALFGEENEDLQKTFVKLQAVMTVINSLQALQNTLQNESAATLLIQNVRTKALAAGQTLYAFATGGATTATKVFRTALLATGIGAVLVLLSSAASAMGVFGDETDKTTGSLEDQAEAAKKLVSGLQDVVDLSERQRNARSGGLDTLQRELKLAEARGASEEELFNLKQKIAKQELLNLAIAGESFVNQFNNAKKNGTLTQSLAEQINDKVTELNKQGADKQNEILAEQLAFETSIRNKAKDEAKRIREKQAEDAKKFAEDERRATLEIFKSNAEERSRKADEAVNNEKLSLDERLAALDTYTKEQKSILEADAAFRLQGVKKGSQQELAINTELQNAIARLTDDGGKRRVEIITNNSEKAAEAYKKTFEDLSKASDKFYGTEQFKREEKKLAEIKALNEAFASGQIKSREDLEKAKEEVQKRYDRAELDAAIKQQLELIAIRTVAGQNTDAEFEKLRALKLKRDEEEIKSEEDKAAKIAAINEELANKKKELLQAGFQLFQDIVAGQFEREKNAIQENKDEIEKKKEREIEAVNASTASEEEKANKIAIINARAAVQKEQLDRRQREIDVRKAQFDRAVNIAQIIGNTARGITAALASIPPNVPLSILIGAIGAAQLASVLARPIPRFKDGKGEGNNYEGPAWVDDGGRPEAIVRADGRVEIGGNKPRLTWVGRNDVVHKDADDFLRNLALRDVAAASTGAPVTESGYGKAMITALTENTNLLKRIADKPVLHQSATRDGLVNIWKWGANYTKWVDEQTQF